MHSFLLFGVCVCVLRVSVYPSDWIGLVVVAALAWLVGCCWPGADVVSAAGVAQRAHVRSFIRAVYVLIYIYVVMLHICGMRYYGLPPSSLSVWSRDAV